MSRPRGGVRNPELNPPGLPHTTRPFREHDWQRIGTPGAEWGGRTLAGSLTSTTAAIRIRRRTGRRCDGDRSNMSSRRGCRPGVRWRLALRRPGRERSWRYHCVVMALRPSPALPRRVVAARHGAAQPATTGSGVARKSASADPTGVGGLSWRVPEPGSAGVAQGRACAGRPRCHSCSALPEPPAPQQLLGHDCRSEHHHHGYRFVVHVELVVRRGFNLSPDSAVRAWKAAPWSVGHGRSQIADG